jgi:hypothetical protein
MHRILTAAAVAGAIAASASAASAQTPPYPGDDAEVILSGQFNPGGTGTLNVGGGFPNTAYPGIINSHNQIPVDDVSDASGVINYAGFAVPADFELNAQHRITWTDGEFLTFCVNSTGAVTSCGSLSAPAGTNLPRTGADYVDDAVRAGALAIGAGALVLLWRRRRLADV